MIERKILEDALDSLEQLEIAPVDDMDTEEIEICVNWLLTYSQSIEDLLKLVLKKK